MLTLKESALVMAKINAHHGNAPLDQLSLTAFHEEIRTDTTIGECMETVRRFYAANPGDRWMKAGDRWMKAGDLNRQIRAMRNETKPSEAQIARETERLDLDADAAWQYRRLRMLGRSPDEAARTALTGRNPLFLEPPSETDPAPTPKRRHFIGHRGPSPAGAAPLASIVGAYDSRKETH